MEMSKGKGKEKGNGFRSLLSQAEAKYPNGKVPGHVRRVAVANSYKVIETKAALRLPHDYAYSDAKPKDLVKPAVLWGEVPKSSFNKTPREQFAAWLTSSANDRFKHTIVNRLWKRLLGAGFIEPIDDIRADNQCVNEAAMKFLGDELVRNDFNIKELMRTILYSNTFQRKPTADDRRIAISELAHADRPGIGYGNIIWALLNTKEFLFVQ